ncbi:MAG: 3',5'-cyclic-nucleotide phosphodiesterase [Pyrinomonadaceae bacterium]
MRVQLLPSTIDENGLASARQHLLTIVIDDRVAIDAGCLAMACSTDQRSNIRDIILTHTHLDHIAGLPLFIDDLFASLTEPIRIHATAGMIETLERDIFNWSIYPRFSELSNDNGAVVEYREFSSGEPIKVAHLSIHAVPVNHQVAANGYVVSDGASTIAITGDTAETDEFWRACNNAQDLRAILMECAFPDEMEGIASVSHHLTPKRLQSELTKLERRNIPIYVINIKPMYRDQVIVQIQDLAIANVQILELGRVYEF